MIAAGSKDAALAVDPVVVINAQNEVPAAVTTLPPPEGSVPAPQALDANPGQLVKAVEPPEASAPPDARQVSSAEPAANPAPASPSIVAVAPKPEPEPIWNQRPDRIHAGASVTTFLRYNRKSTRPNSGIDAPIVALPTLAALDPSFNIVQCIAGCPGDRGTVVFYAARYSSRTGQPIEAPGPQVAVAKEAPKQDQNVIACIAGCYSTPKTYIARYAAAKAQNGHGTALPPPAFSAAMVQTSAPLHQDLKSATVLARHPVVMRTQARASKPRSIVRRINKPLGWRTTTMIPQDRLIPRRAWATRVVRY